MESKVISTLLLALTTDPSVAVRNQCADSLHHLHKTNLAQINETNTNTTDTTSTNNTNTTNNTTTGNESTLDICLEYLLSNQHDYNIQFNSYSQRAPVVNHHHAVKSDLPKCNKTRASIRDSDGNIIADSGGGDGGAELESDASPVIAITTNTGGVETFWRDIEDTDPRIRERALRYGNTCLHMFMYE